MENFESTPHAGWYPTELLAWIQNQDPKILAGIFLLEMVTIWVAILLQNLDLEIHKYQDQIQELCCQITQPIKDAFGGLGLILGEGVQDTVASTPYVYLNIMKPKVEPASEEYRQDFMNKYT